MQNVPTWRFLQFAVYASLISDRLTFHGSKDFNSIIAPDKATKQSPDLKCVMFLFMIHSYVEVQIEQYRNAQKPSCYQYSYVAIIASMCLSKSHNLCSHPDLTSSL